VVETDFESKPASPSPVGFITRLSSYVADALRYWEPRRLAYNAVLALVVVAHFALAWPASWEKLSFDLLLGFFFLAVVANICYCGVYAPDLFVQFSGLHKAWRWGRVLILVVGTAFAATIAHFFARGIFEP
jgi:hypothetical protein